jgi:hypothetical protein
LLRGGRRAHPLQLSNSGISAMSANKRMMNVIASQIIF